MINLWRKPAHKKYFEELFIDAFKSVREATKIVNRLFPDMGMFFKVTVSSIIDLSSLYSLSIQDLCDYNNLTIRIRLYEIVSSKASSAAQHCLPSPAKEVSINLESRPPVANSPGFRPMSISRRDKNSLDTFSSTPATGTSFKHISMSLRDGGLSAALTASTAATPTVVEAALYVDPDSCRVLLETALNSFYDGLTVLRTLFSTIVPLMNYLQTIKQSNKETSALFGKNKSVIQSLFQSPMLNKNDFGDGPVNRISDFISTVVQILDHDRVSIEMNIDEDKDLSAYSCVELYSYYSSGLECIQGSLLNNGLRGDIFKRKCSKHCLAKISNKGSSAISDFLLILLESLEVCLFKSIISCFEAAGNLVIKDEKKIDNDENEDEQNTPQSDFHQKQDEVRILLRTFSELRQDKQVALIKKTGAIGYQHTGYEYSSAIHNVIYDVAMSPEQLNSGTILPNSDEITVNETVGDASIQTHTENNNNVGDLHDNNSLYDGADDWAVCQDESTGYSYIYSAKLEESRWLPG